MIEKKLTWSLSGEYAVVLVHVAITNYLNNKIPLRRGDGGYSAIEDFAVTH